MNLVIELKNELKDAMNCEGDEKTPPLVIIGQARDWRFSCDGCHASLDIPLVTYTELPYWMHVNKWTIEGKPLKTASTFCSECSKKRKNG